MENSHPKVITFATNKGGISKNDLSKTIPHYLSLPIFVSFCVSLFSIYDIYFHFLAYIFRVVTYKTRENLFGYARFVQ